MASKKGRNQRGTLFGTQRQDMNEVFRVASLVLGDVVCLQLLKGSRKRGFAKRETSMRERNREGMQNQKKTIEKTRERVPCVLSSFVTRHHHTLKGTVKTDSNECIECSCCLD